MVGSVINLSAFGGMIPRMGERLLPDTAATLAKNVKLQSGELRGIRSLKILKDYGAVNVARAYRIPDPDNVEGETWIPVTSIDHIVLKAPLLGDSFQRFYKFGDGRPQYNTLARIRNEAPWFWLGVPAPASNLTVTPPAGNEDTRFYVYTFVSPYGEEGPPSEPIEATGAIAGTWNISSMDTVVPDAANRATGYTKRLYRTVTGFTSAEFFYVADIALATATYADTLSNEIVSRNNRLESTSWTAPIETLTSAVVMPNGFFVGWNANDIYFSEPYRPHAWPVAYELATEYEVLGAGVFGQSVGLATTGTPYVGTGVNPASLTLSKVDSPKPCLSKYGVVSFPEGVIYPSHNGLILLTTSSANVMTNSLVTKTEWESRYNPSGLKSTRYQTSYIGYYENDKALIIDPSEPQSGVIEVDSFDNVVSITTDPYTGEVFFVRNNIVYQWDATDRPRERFQWKSKLFVFPKPCNLGAAAIQAGSTVDSIQDNLLLAAGYAAWNTERIKFPLAPIGGNALGLARSYTLPSPEDAFNLQNSLPIGGSPLLWAAREIVANAVTIFNVYAGGTLVYSSAYDGQATVRLPSGLKSDTWQVEVLSKVSIFSIKLAETGKALARV
jgi:hypothetical protein